MTEHLVMDAPAAAALRAATADHDDRLDPREIAGGDAAGRFALPMAVLADPAFARLAETLGALETATLGPEAWPAAE